MKPIKLSHLYIAMGLTLTIGGFQNCSKMGVSDIAVEDIGPNSQMGLDPALSDAQLADNANTSSANTADDSGMANNMDITMDPNAGSSGTSLNLGFPGGTGDNFGMPNMPGTSRPRTPANIVDAPTLSQIFDNLPSDRIRPINLATVGEEDDSTVLTPEDYSRPYSGICSLFEGIQLPIAENGSTDDYKRSHAAGSVEILEARDVKVSHVAALGGGVLIGSARNVDINHVAGGVIIKSAQSVEIGHEAGRLRITANEITKIEHAAGAVCLNAIKIGVLAHVAGGSKIIAKEIDEIKHYAGTIHIYGARVKKIKHQAGKICLHDGAVVLDENHVLGGSQNCD